MVKSGRANPKPAPKYRRHFIQEWLDYKNKTHENLADGIEKSRSYVTKIVNGTRPYTQEFLEATAEYLAIDVASLLMRNPQKTDAIWSVWDHAKPGERAKILEYAHFITKDDKTGSG